MTVESDAALQADLHRLARSFPTTWDPRRDMVVLVAGAPLAYAEALVAQGHERVFLYTPENLPGDVPPSGTRIWRHYADLYEGVLGLGGSPPAHLTVHVPIGASDPDAAQACARQVAVQVGEAIECLAHQLTTANHFGPTWLLQGVDNLPAVASMPSVQALKHAFAGRPAVMVSPGPSLEKNIHLLPGLMDRAVILCGTHVLSALRDAGVTPHLVVAADPGDLLRHYDGIDTLAFGGLVIGATCQPGNFDVPARRRFAFASNGPLDDWIFRGLGEEAGLSTGGSVACSMASLALTMGCDPVVLVGQDLAITEGSYYFSGSLDGNARVQPGATGSFYLRKPGDADGPGFPTDDGGLRFTRDQALVEVPGYHGGTVPTSRAFEAFRRWFVALATAHHGNVRLINATEGGARLDPMEHLPLAEALPAEGTPPFDVDAVLESAGQVDEERRCRRLAAHLGQMIDALAPCQALAVRCRRFAKSAASDGRRLARLETAEAELKAALKPVHLFALVAHREILEAQRAGQAARTLDENLRASARLYGVVEQAVALLSEPLRTAHERLASSGEPS